jgi:hypothetical protein
MSYYNYDTGSFRGYCVMCGDGAKKSDLDRLLIRHGSYGSPKTLAYLCRNCATALADHIGVALPDLDEIQSRKMYDITSCPACLRNIKSTDRFCRYCGHRLKGENHDHQR